MAKNCSFENKKNNHSHTDLNMYQSFTVNYLILRERPFNLKGGVMVFFLKNILIPNVAEKNIPILVEEKKNNLIQSFCHVT
jgi:hypothetical protein